MFIPVRKFMTCCADDMKYYGYPCKLEKRIFHRTPERGAVYALRAAVHNDQLRFCKLLHQRIPHIQEVHVKRAAVHCRINTLQLPVARVFILLCSYAVRMERKDIPRSS